MRANLEVEGLREERLPLVPHLVQLKPVLVQGVEPLTQEHVLRVGLALGDAHAVLVQLLVFGLVAHDLGAQRLVLREHFLGLVHV